MENLNKFKTGTSFDQEYFNSLIDNKSIVLVGNGDKGKTIDLDKKYDTVIRFNHAPGLTKDEKLGACLVGLCNKYLELLTEDYLNYFRDNNTPLYLSKSGGLKYYEVLQEFLPTANIQLFTADHNSFNCRFTVGTKFLIGLNNSINEYKLTPKSISTIGFSYNEEFSKYINSRENSAGGWHKSALFTEIKVRSELITKLNIKIF